MVMTFKKILCAVDFSESSRAAMQTAAKLGAEPGVEVTLVHVWEAPVLPNESGFMLENELLEGIVRESERALAAWKTDLERMGARKVTSKLLAGVVWDRIVHELSSDPSYDLAVIGTHGRTGLKHVLLGSVAERVVRHAPCPVLVVRTRAA
jgi:nucleotide-binding universal stress UspA family protein